jgi:hypothetical protein
VPDLETHETPDHSSDLVIVFREERGDRIGGGAN